LSSPEWVQQQLALAAGLRRRGALPEPGVGAGRRAAVHGQPAAAHDERHGPPGGGGGGGSGGSGGSGGGGGRVADRQPPSRAHAARARTHRRVSRMFYLNP